MKAALRQGLVIECTRSAGVWEGGGGGRVQALKPRTRELEEFERARGQNQKQLAVTEPAAPEPALVFTTGEY